MRKLLTTAGFLFAMVSSAYANIAVSSPATNSTVGSPVRFIVSASPTSTAPVTSMRIYVDSNAVYTVSGNKIDTSIPLATGTRRLTYVAWDSTGASQRWDSSINVGSSTTTPTGSNVVISSPGNGATVSNPVHVVASASASAPITAMKVYVDGQEKWHVNGSRVDTSLTLASGTRNVTVQAWDSTGQVYKTPITVNVSGTSSYTGSTTENVGTAIGNIDQMTGWESCDKCAGINANGPSTPHSMTIGRSTPSLDGSSSEFWMGGDTPYSQALWWKQLGPRDSARNFVYDLYYYIKDPHASQALEFDVNQSVDGKKYIFGTECNLKETRTWRVWDNVNVKWINTGVGCAVPQAYSWVHLVWEFQRLSNGNLKYVSVTVNGQKSYINREFAPRAVSARELNVAFQIDGDYKQTDYSVWLDKVTLRYW